MSRFAVSSDYSSITPEQGSEITISSITKSPLGNLDEVWTLKKPGPRTALRLEFTGFRWAQ